MTDLIVAAAKLQMEIDNLGLSNCIIGGLALQAWGEIRVTRDVDFTVLTHFVDEEAKIATLSMITRVDSLRSSKSVQPTSLPRS